MRWARGIAAMALIAGAVALTLGWWLWSPTSAPRTRPPTALVRTGQATLTPLPATPPAPSASPATPAEARWHRTFTQRAHQATRACDLGMVTRCQGPNCAAVLVAPDLDRFSGWVGMTRRSPRFVLSTLARDLGVPVRMLPCGEAVAQLVGQAGVTTVSLTDGTEVWCSASNASDRVTAPGRALCDQLAADAIGSGKVSFEQGQRQLDFDRE